MYNHAIYNLKDLAVSWLIGLIDHDSCTALKLTINQYNKTHNINWRAIAVRDSISNAFRL